LHSLYLSRILTWCADYGGPIFKVLKRVFGWNRIRTKALYVKFNEIFVLIFFQKAASSTQ